MGESKGFGLRFRKIKSKEEEEGGTQGTASMSQCDDVSRGSGCLWTCYYFNGYLSWVTSSQIKCCHVLSSANKVCACFNVTIINSVAFCISFYSFANIKEFSTSNLLWKKRLSIQLWLHFLILLFLWIIVVSVLVIPYFPPVKKHNESTSFGFQISRTVSSTMKHRKPFFWYLCSSSHSLLGDRFG